MSCANSCPNVGQFLYPTTGSDGRKVLQAWLAGSDEILKISFRQAGRAKDALLIKNALSTKALGGRCCLLLGTPEDMKCQAVSSSAKTTRFRTCYWCSLEATGNDLSDTLVSLPHIYAQDSGAPAPSQMTVGQILRNIYVKTPAKNSNKSQITLLKFLGLRAFDWMVTARIPRFMLIHVCKLALRCGASCHRLACGHRVPATHRVEWTEQGDRMISVPGLSSAWLITKRGNKFQLISAVADEPQVASPVTPQNIPDRIARANLLPNFRQLQPVSQQNQTPPVQPPQNQVQHQPPIIQIPAETPVSYSTRSVPRQHQGQAQTQLFPGQSPGPQIVHLQHRAPAQ